MIKVSCVLHNNKLYINICNELIIVYQVMCCSVIHVMQSSRTCCVYQAEQSRCPWALYQIRKLAGYTCAGKAGNVFLATDLKKPLVSDPGMHHGPLVTLVPWCMSGSLNRGGGGNIPVIPGTCATHSFTYLAKGGHGTKYYPCILIGWDLTKPYMETYHKRLNFKRKVVDFEYVVSKLSQEELSPLYMWCPFVQLKYESNAITCLIEIWYKMFTV